jgi:hypothetical protein
MVSKKQIKNAIRRGAKNVKREAAPIVKAAARAAINAAKQELRRGGRDVLQRGLKFGAQNIFGMGDYRTNDIIKGQITSSPSFGTTKTTFRRREPLGKVVSSETPGAFKMDKFRVNAGLSKTFPWLSGFANNYESYRPLSVVFEYVPTSGMAVASNDTALGSITMAAQYNPFAVDPLNLQQIQGYRNSVTLAPYEHGLHGIECNPRSRQAETLLIRNANIQANGGLTVDTGYDTLFDLCEFFIATEGMQAANVVLGQIWVSYSIELSNPIVPIIQPFNPSLTMTSIAGQDYPSANIFAVANGTAQWSSTPLVEISTSGTDLFLPNAPPGSYFFMFNSSYTINVAQTASLISGVNTAINAIWRAPNTGISSAEFSLQGYFQVLTDSATTKISMADLPAGTIDQWSLSIIRVPTGFSGIIPIGPG